VINILIIKSRSVQSIGFCSEQNLPRVGRLSKPVFKPIHYFYYGGLFRYINARYLLKWLKGLALGLRLGLRLAFFERCSFLPL